MPITRLLLAVGVCLVFEPMLVDRLTAGLELVLLPYEKLLLGATGRGILDFFAEAAVGGLTFVEASSKLFDVFANNAAFPLRLDKIEVTVG